jgi:RNA polymerase sigma-70 factor, ECF subfamily
MERALAERIVTGDRAAFDDLVRNRIDSVYRTSLAILGDPADAADATQETFVSAWTSRNALRDPDRFDAWLGRINVNACRAQLRRRTRSKVREIRMTDRNGEPAFELPHPDGAPDRNGEPAFELPHPDGAPDDRTADADLFDRAFARLSVDDRAALTLHHLQERPVAEIAGALGIPVGTLKARLFRARAALESALAKESR